jgi:hypothetical protein
LVIPGGLASIAEKGEREGDVESGVASEQLRAEGNEEKLKKLLALIEGGRFLCASQQLAEYKKDNVELSVSAADIERVDRITAHFNRNVVNKLVSKKLWEEVKGEKRNVKFSFHHTDNHFRMLLSADFPNTDPIRAVAALTEFAKTCPTRNPGEKPHLLRDESLPQTSQLLRCSKCHEEDSKRFTFSKCRVCGTVLCSKCKQDCESWLCEDQVTRIIPPRDRREWHPTDVAWHMRSFVKHTLSSEDMGYRVSVIDALEEHGAFFVCGYAIPDLSYRSDKDNAAAPQSARGQKQSASQQLDEKTKASLDGCWDTFRIKPLQNSAAPEACGFELTFESHRVPMSNDYRFLWLPPPAEFRDSAAYKELCGGMPSVKQVLVHDMMDKYPARLEELMPKIDLASSKYASLYSALKSHLADRQSRRVCSYESLT